MTTVSAEIIPFPVGGRAALRKQRDDVKVAEQSPRVARIAFGSWYHEEAIREAERPRKN